MSNYLTLNQSNHSLTLLNAATSTANAITLPENSENNKITGIYPIGSLYFNINGVDPATYFGGYWELYSEGQVLIGVDPDDPDFDEGGKNGGDNYATLTTNQLPSHNHAIRRVDSGGAYDSSNGIARVRARTNTDSGTSWGLTTSSVGGSAAHNNQMPYITCYIWRRVN